MLLLIDNYDSFTYNLVQYLGELGEDVRTYRNDEITLDEIERLVPARIVISYSASKPSSTCSAARRTALALTSVSFHSFSGTESATMPAAACA